MSRRRALVALLSLVLAAGCTVKWVKFPARQYLADHIALRLEVQDETYSGRRQCRAAVGVSIAPGTGVPVPTMPPEKWERIRGKCEALQVKLDRWDRMTEQTIDAVITGGTIDTEQLAEFRKEIGPILGLAREILTLAAL